LEHRDPNEYGPRSGEEVAEALTDRDDSKTTTVASRVASLAAGSSYFLAKVGTRKGQRASPKNCTTAARTPTTVAVGTMARPSRPSTCPSRTASGASKTAVSMKPYQSSLRPTPPALKRLKTSSVGLRRMFG
jgi:hypothetical protein